MRYQVESIARNHSLSEEIVRKMPSLRGPLLTAAIILPDDEPRRRRGQTGRGTTRTESAPDTVRRATADPHSEAIVLRYGRPSLTVHNDSFEIPVADYWKARLYPTKSRLDRAIRSVGRIEVPELREPYQGTGWMISPGIVVTNRHVALLFAQRGSGSAFTFQTTPFGDALNPRVDFREEALTTEPFEVRIAEVLYIAPDDQSSAAVPDIAFVRVERIDSRPLPPPIPLFKDDPKKDQIVAAIGYPARDPYNPISDQARIFGDTFDIKRLAPGEVMRRLDADTFTHDCTTLGGSSGSVIVDVATGAAAGLHFSGAYRDANYAVSAATLKRTLADARHGVTIETIGPTKPSHAESERVVKAASLGDRTGYRTDFLGTGAKDVPLPRLSQALLAQVARQPSSAGVPESERHILRYEHYSVVMHAARRMAIYTASNIDGAASVRIKRTSDPWALDPRIAKSFQIDNSLYVGNDFDRGHLVRRLDPAWGATAKQGELDTFFFTNCTPQIHYFNDTLWGDLEDYLLDNADTREFRACIFTGPTLDKHDPEYRSVLIPTAYWKVAIMVHAERDELTATAYMVSQSDLLTHVEFAYGQFKTYQIPITRVEAITGLDFGSMRDHDPFVPDEGVGVRELLGPEGIRL